MPLDLQILLWKAAGHQILASVARRRVRRSECSSNSFWADFSRLFPAAAQCFIEVDKTLVLVVSRLRQRKFGTKERSLAIKDREISGGSAFVAHERHVDRFLYILHGTFQALADSVIFGKAKRRIRDISPVPLNRLLIHDQCLTIF